MNEQAEIPEMQETSGENLAEELESGNTKKEEDLSPSKNIKENVPPAEIPQKSSKRKMPFVIAGAVLLVAAIGGIAYWLYSRQFETTDDAFIDADIVQVSPKVSAYVSKVYVKSNQYVHKGDLLLELDPRDCEARLKQAEAQLHIAQAQREQAAANANLTVKTTRASQIQAKSNVQAAQTNVDQTVLAAEARKLQIRQAQTAVKTAQANLAQINTQIPQAQANLDLAQKNYKRQQVLFDNGDISKQSFDQALTALQTAQAQMDSARKQVAAAQAKIDEAQANVSTVTENYRQSLAQVNVTKSQVDESTGRLQDANAAPERVAVSETQVAANDATIEQAQAAVNQAELELSYTKIYAPEDGFITKKSIEEGQLVQPGSALMAISVSDDVWVVANFKETQLELMRVGQAVDLKVDAYPNETFHGTIESFQVGTGSRFSVLPAENASGNYVKVVQRIPVKIVFDEKPDKVHLLAPGMSVEPVVKVR